MGRTCGSGVRKLGSHLLLSRNRRQVAAWRNGIKGVRFTCAGQKALSHFRALLLPRSQKQREKRLQHGSRAAQLDYCSTRHSRRVQAVQV